MDPILAGPVFGRSNFFCYVDLINLGARSLNYSKTRDGNLEMGATCARFRSYCFEVIVAILKSFIIHNADSPRTGLESFVIYYPVSS